MKEPTDSPSTTRSPGTVSATDVAGGTAAAAVAGPGTLLPQVGPSAGPGPTGDGSRSLLWSLTGSQLGLSITFGAIPSVLLALQVEQLVGDGRKAGVLAVITTIGALAAMVAHPVVGAWSDRTRSRWGRRTPWMLGGTAVAAPVIWGMGLTDSLVVIGALFVVSEVALAAAQGPVIAVLPDRVASRVRGRYSAALGMGVMIGTVLGQGLGSVLSGNLTVAYLVLGTLPLALALSRLVADPDPSNRAEPLEPIELRALLATYWLDPRTYPDFWWAFVSRLLTYTGFFTVYGYTLYILDDYIGLGDDAVTKVPLFAGLAAVGICLTTVPAGIWSDRIGRRRPFVLVSSVGLGVAFMIPMLTTSFAGVLVMGFVAGLAFGCYQAVDSALITEVLPRSLSYGQDLGIVNMASMLPQVLAPAIAGAIVVGTGGYFAIFPAAALLAALGGLAIMRVRSVR